MFVAISKAAQSPIDSVSAAVAPIAVPAMIAFSLSSVISAVALVTRGYFAVVQCRRRRLDISVIGSTKPYSERLATKIEDGERTLKLAGLGLALAMCEDLPMAGIAICFLANAYVYEVPTFNLISMVTSGLMLGLKVAPVMTFPAQWAKLSKWKSRVQPRCEAAEPGTELREPTRKPEPEPLTYEQHVAHLMQLKAAVAALAHVVGPAHIADDKRQFEKWEHQLTLMVNKAEDGPKLKRKSPPAANPQVLASTCAPTAPPSHHAHTGRAPRALRDRQRDCASACCCRPQPKTSRPSLRHVMSRTSCEQPPRRTLQWQLCCPFVPNTTAATTHSVSNHV
jgi:hypothetical protein